MTQSEKLEALVRKAIDGGWQDLTHTMEWDTADQQWRYDAIGGEEWHSQIDLNTVIFNHDFAKALFGDNISEAVDSAFMSASFSSELDIDQAGLVTIWQYRLQQAVIAEDPVGYMYGVVFDE